MVLVTGGTGLVGAHLLYKLLNENQNVRAIYRDKKTFKTVKRIFSYYTKNVEPLFGAIQWLEANINNIPALTKAFQDVTTVYHCAAFINFEPNKFNTLQKINIEGTANIVNLSIAFGVKKLCYVSSIAAIGEPKTHTTITEETSWNPEADNSVYAITKYGAELEVWRGTQEGLHAVIVNPGVIIGAGIWHSGSGSIINLVYNKTKYYTSGNVGCVAVEDVVQALYLLMQSDVVNKRFILVSNTWTYKKLLSSCAIALGVKPPKTKATNSMLQVAWRLDWLKHLVTGRPRKLTKSVVQSLQSDLVYDGSKIEEYIGFRYSDLGKKINNTCALYLKDLNKNRN